jgi:hypothetical protein
MKTGALLLACGALARELVAIQRRNGWDHLKIQCLPAELHNTPDRIPAAVEAALEKYTKEFRHVFVAYADCGTGGLLDKVLEKYGVERIPGAHCYEFFSGSEVFGALADDEPGTYYLTDFLARHFDRLVVEGLGLDRHPELREQYFGNYRKLVYLEQDPDAGLRDKARRHADYLELEYEAVVTGLGPVETVLGEQVIQWRN